MTLCNTKPELQERESTKPLNCYINHFPAIRHQLHHDNDDGGTFAPSQWERCGFPLGQVPQPVLQDQQVHPSQPLFLPKSFLSLSIRVSFSPFLSFLDLPISSFLSLCQSEAKMHKYNSKKILYGDQQRTLVSVISSFFYLLPGEELLQLYICHYRKIHVLSNLSII